MAGRKKKPTKQKIIQGTFRKDRAPKHEPDPTPVSEVPKPPSTLNNAGKKLWKSLAQELVDKGLLTVVDIPALEVCCYNYGMYVDLSKSIRRMVDREDGTRKRQTIAEYLNGKNSQITPELTAMFKLFNIFKSYLIEFGLTPAARAKIDLPEPKPKEPGADTVEKLWNEK